MCRIAYTFILVALSGLLSAQQIRNFQTLTGKKDVAAKVLFQSSEGYLWVGTAEGLVKFDGKRPTLFTKEEGMAENEVSAIYEGSSKKLIVGHKNGKVSFIYKDKADTFLLNSKLGEEKITGFYEDKTGNLWIATYGNGLYQYYGNSLKHYTTKEGLGDDLIYDLAFDGHGNLWLGTDAGITVVSLNTQLSKNSFTYLSTKNGLPDNIVRKFCPDKRGSMLIAMQDSGVCFYDLKNKLISRNEFFSNWSYGAVMDIACIAQKKQYLIATEKFGLISITDGRIRIINSGNGIPSNETTNCFVDREYNIWLATNKGVSMLFEQRHQFMLNQNVPALAIQNENTIWIAGKEGIAEVMTNEVGEVVVKKIANPQLSNLDYSCMMVDNESRIWIGTYGSGVIIYSIETGKITKLNTKTGLSEDNISHIFSSIDGTIWISTLGGGVVKAKYDGNAFELEVYNEENGKGSSYVYEVFVSKKNSIWCATDGNGLQVLENGKFVSVKTNLKSKTIYSIAEDSKGKLWFSTSDDGIVCYDGSTMQYHGIKNGLRDAQPPILLADSNKILLFHAKGVDVINPEKNSELSYFEVSETDIEPNLNAACLDGKGMMYIGTSTGILKFRSGDRFFDTITPIVLINGMKVQFENTPIDSVSSFSYNQNSFIFEYTAVLLKNPDKAHFRYKLKGYDNDWFISSSNLPATYNNLMPGEYEFMIEASNEEGKWSSPTIYKFTIAKAIWMHWWFWVLVVLTLVIIIYSFIRYRLRSLQKEKIVLEKKVEERTYEIQKQAGIIEEKNAELEQLSLVASKTDNVVVIMDALGKLEFVNESFIKLNNLNLEQMKQKFGDTIFDISNNPNIRNIINDCTRSKQSVVYESLNMLENGEKVWESSTLTPIFDDDGHLKKMIIIDTDVTERKKQEEIIVQKNKDITDSINYAQKIQRAILPKDEEVKLSLPDSFILYLMKDIVSGDFYWYADKKEYCIIAAIDCTGHGVPGAFMSLIGYNILNQIVNERKIETPSEILLELNNGIIKALNKDKSGNSNADGMDMAICKVYKTKKVIEYSGAMRPLWIIGKNKEIKEIRATKMPIGALPDSGYSGVEYLNHEIEIKEGDTFYIFTDGYADQFGGEKIKKFSTAKFKELLLSVHELEMEEQRKKVLEAHMAWKGLEEQVDDILVIGFRF